MLPPIPAPAIPHHTNVASHILVEAMILELFCNLNNSMISLFPSFTISIPLKLGWCPPSRTVPRSQAAFTASRPLPRAGTSPKLPVTFHYSGSSSGQLRSPDRWAAGRHPTVTGVGGIPPPTTRVALPEDTG